VAGSNHVSIVTLRKSEGEMYLKLFVLWAFIWPFSVHADWSQTLAEAKGDTVYFNAWGGSPAINAYIENWADVAKERYGIDVQHVKVNDVGAVITGLETAQRAGGRSDQGSVDLMWINGENFARMKRAELLSDPFVETLPNATYLDLSDPSIAFDFSVPTDGLEAPWGRAQLVMMYDSAQLVEPPRSLDALLTHAQDNPGRVTYPEPPNFHGTTFLKQILLETTSHPEWLMEPYREERFEQATQGVWQFLDALHPVAWRQAQSFPNSAEDLMNLLSDGLIDVALSFNPNDASRKIKSGEFAPTVRTYVHQAGTIGNTHFLAIPFNAQAPAAARVFVNLLLSPEAQADKANPEIWGDPTVLSMERLDPADRQLFDALPVGAATLSPEALGQPLPEPHASWTEPLERAWMARYFGQ
jgi:putative thiamine transport system substrate-binding protein